ncbi:hypothetical protein GQ53DRAFT_84425 [Thozetella sp. PMI_491]|nr:hypothetical protein GQ53DRAFT_84425 [Thozetella sp. PMI_491]
MADPLSITTGCLSLISAVAKTTVSVASFIRGCRDARADLTAVNLQLSELRIVLELLHEDHGAAVIPDTLQRQILSIIANCTAVVDKIDDLLERYNVEAGKAIGGAVTSVKWVAFGKAEAAGLRMSLEAHRGSLELALELVSISLAKSTKEDTSAIREGVVDIKLDTTQILEELARLRAIVSGGGMSAAVPGQASVLEKWLDSLTSYAETVVNDVDWSSDGGSIHAVSGRPSLEIPVADQSQEPKDEAAASGHNKPEDLPQPQHLQEQIDSQITALQTPELAETHISVNSILRKPIGPRLSSARAIESNDVKPNPSGEGKSRTDAANTTGPLLNNNEEPQTSSSVAWSAVFDVMSSVTYGTATVDEPIPKETKIELAWEPESPPSNSVVGSQRDLVFNEPPPPVYEETVSKEETSEDERPKQRRTVYDELMEIMARPRELHWAADAQIKVVLVGDGCSGKTTMLK